MADLRLRTADDQRASWVAALVVEVAAERGWTVTDTGPGRPDAVAVITAVGTDAAPVAEPAFVVEVEPGTPRSPTPVESAAHLLPRAELVVGSFKARRNQQATRAALERFLARVETGLADPGDAAAAAGAPGVIEESRALLAAVDAWLAHATVSADDARALHADRAILDAAIGAPVIDLVIVERAAARLAAAIAP
jgi:hypothetical protein